MRGGQFLAHDGQGITGAVVDHFGFADGGAGALFGGLGGGDGLLGGSNGGFGLLQSCGGGFQKAQQFLQAVALLQARGGGIGGSGGGDEAVPTPQIAGGRDQALAGL